MAEKVAIKMGKKFLGKKGRKYMEENRLRGPKKEYEVSSPLPSCRKKFPNFIKG